MDRYTCQITATVGIDLYAEDYQSAAKKALRMVDDLQHATTGALKYLGVRWELDSVLQKQEE